VLIGPRFIWVGVCMRKTAVVTGGSGFVGWHARKELERRGYVVLNIDILNGADAKTFFQRMSDRYDLVVHCAYVVGGRATIDGRNTALLENLQLDSMMFDWALRTKQKALLYFSSSAAYPKCLQAKSCDKEWEGSWHTYRDLTEDCIDFDDNEMPDANYGWAKLTGERQARVAADNGLRVHVVRPFSGYSHEQSLDYPFPSIMKRARNFDFSVWGPPGQCRDWIHIDDVINGALAVYENDDRRPVNLCTGRATEMGDLMRLASWKFHGFQPESIIYQPDKPSGVFYRVGDPTRMNEHYTAKISLEEGIDRAVKGVS
jgi:nucleoside-diphosphate-sugar epimerase